MRVLGIDPSLNDTGWAVIDTEKGEPPELVGSGRFRSKSDDFFLTKYKRAWEGVDRVIEKYKPDFLSIEIPPPAGSYSAGLYPLWVTMADTSLKHRIPFLTLVPTQVKAYARHVLGEKGKMFKSDMVETAKRILNTQKAMNHNVADAIIVAWSGARFWLLYEKIIGEEELTRGERLMFSRTITRRATGRVEGVGIIYKEGEAYYDLRLPKYDPLYIDPEIKARMVEFAEDLPPRVRKILIREGFLTADDIMSLGQKEGVIKGLTRFKGIGKKSAEIILTWSSLHATNENDVNTENEV